MYAYDWDPETGGLLLTVSSARASGEPRPVYYRELDLLGFDKYWKYEKNDSYPYMWAESNNYYYRGQKIATAKGGALYVAPTLEIHVDPDTNDAPLRFVDVPAMVEKNRDLMEKLAQDTIKKVYNTYAEYRRKVDLFYVAFSGGKDSVVALDIVQRALPHNEFVVVFGDTGMEFPDTYKVVEETQKECKESGIDFLTSRSELDPEYTWSHIGPPAQRIRWCCSVHKTAPQVLLLRKYTSNPRFRGMAITGIRGFESASRSEYEDVSLGEKVRGQFSCHPILEWNSAEVFLYIYENNLIFNSAYKKGNSRAGCLVCPEATAKNMFFKERAYSKATDGFRSTTTFNNIILNTTAKVLSTENAVQEFMNIGGWKARRSGKELSFAHDVITETNEKNKLLSYHILQPKTSWREWIKTLGEITYFGNEDVDIVFGNNNYHVHVDELQNETVFTIDILGGRKTDIIFLSALKTVLRKTAYCIGCQVCESNCPYGYITTKNGSVQIDKHCISCRKCHDVPCGCVVANSLRLPKKERKMGSVDRYANMGVEYSWVVDYFKKKDEFWDSPHSLGTNKVKHLKNFLTDSEVTVKGKFSSFGEVVDKLGVQNPIAWALMACNFAYTSEFNWWIKNINFSCPYTPDEIYSMLDDSMSQNSRSHIVSAFKNTFISNPALGIEVGMGKCDYEAKNGLRRLNSVVRTPWANPNSEVILYSLYKFAEACGGYYQFTLTRLLDFEVESDGVSPAQIFGLDRETMERLLTGLGANYPEFVTAQFNLGLDSITLNAEKTSADVLTLF